MDIKVIIILILLCSFAEYLLLKSVKPTSKLLVALSLFLVAGSFVIRYLVLDYQTLDYKDFLKHWVDFFRTNGGFKALKYEVGNYNIPYLYFLALFSYSNINDLYLIKLLSIFFDILLAYSAMLLVRLVGRNDNKALACYIVILYLPTVFFNGSLWGQCDSTYTALFLLSLYCALDKKPGGAMILAALSFGFKLQAVFVLPIFAVLLMRKELSLRHLLIFPVTYILLVLPAVLLGRPFWDTVTLYFSQTGSIGSGLNYNSPSVFAFLWRPMSEDRTQLLSKLGIITAAVYMLALLAICYVNRKKLNDKLVLCACLLLAVGIPFFLPHMHDRYFFAADVLSLIAAFSMIELLPTPLLVQFASLLGYHAYLKMRYLLTMDKGAWSLIAVILLAAGYFIYSLRSLDKKPQKLKS